MSVIEVAKTHLDSMVADVEALLTKHRESVAAVQTEVANEAAKIPTWEDVRALIARVPVA